MNGQRPPLACLHCLYQSSGKPDWLLVLAAGKGQGVVATVRVWQRSICSRSGTPRFLCKGVSVSVFHWSPAVIAPLRRVSLRQVKSSSSDFLLCKTLLYCFESRDSLEE